jgi:hypothetical protein
MLSTKYAFADRLLALMMTAAGSAGCSRAVASPPASPTAIDATPPMSGAPRRPDGAARWQSEGDGMRPCRVEGTPRTVAATAVPAAGVDADAGEENVCVRLATKTRGRAVIALDPRSLDAVDADAWASEPEGTSCLGMSVFSVPRAWSGGALARSMLSRTFMAANDATAFTGPSESEQTRVGAPVVADVDSRRSVFAWTEGCVDTGMDVRVLTVDGEGEPLGAPVTVPHAGSAIGQPAVAVAASGWGVVAFIDSNGHGFELVAATLNCSSPATPPPVRFARQARDNEEQKRSDAPGEPR